MHSHINYWYFTNNWNYNAATSDSSFNSIFNSTALRRLTPTQDMVSTAPIVVFVSRPRILTLSSGHINNKIGINFSPGAFNGRHFKN